MDILRKLLFPFSIIYSLILRIRNVFYDTGIFRSRSYKLPLICVGNLSVGGTGKTPMTEHLITLLKDNFKVAVLSRGYKRKTNGFILAEKKTNAYEIGDEPFQYFEKFSNIHVAVDENRENGINLLQKIVKPDVIILDDAFQHRKVNAGLNILLTVYNDLYIDDFILPAGNLRDNRRQARRAQIIVVTKCPESLSGEEKNHIIKRLKLKPYQSVFFTSVEYDKILRSADSEMNMDALNGKQFTLVTGIANPKPLVKYLEHKKLNFKHLKFNDHHSFSTSEIKGFENEDIIVTTEKDFVRLKDRLQNVYYLGIKTSFLFNEEERFADIIIKYVMSQ